MIGAIDQGHIGAPMLLDLSAAFDTVDDGRSSNSCRCSNDDSSELLEVHLIGWWVNF